MALLPRLELRSTGNDDQSTQSILQHLYFIIAVFAALLLVAFRIYLLRRRNRPVTDFFAISSSNHNYNSQPPEDHVFGSSYQHSSPTPLAPLPSAYRRNRRVNAADVDDSGRRLGLPDDPDWDGKDVLPAYNNIDRPPKYVFGGVFHQEHVHTHETNPGDNSAAADVATLPTTEQPTADVTNAIHDNIEPAPPTPHLDP